MIRKLLKIFALFFAMIVIVSLTIYIFYRHQLARLYANTKIWTSDTGNTIGTMTFSYVTSFNTIENAPGVGRVHAKEAIVLAKINNTPNYLLFQWIPIRIFLGGETGSGEPIHLFITPIAYQNTNQRPPVQPPSDLDAKLRTIKTFRAGIFFTRNNSARDAQCALCLVYNFFLAQNKRTQWIPLLPAAIYLEMER